MRVDMNFYNYIIQKKHKGWQFEKMYVDRNYYPLVSKEIDIPRVACFVATAVYEDMHHPMVEELRKFRDTILPRAPFGAGKRFHNWYYENGFSLANKMSDIPGALTATKGLLTPTVLAMKAARLTVAKLKGLGNKSFTI